MADRKEKPIEDYKQMNSEEIELFQEIPLGDYRWKYCNMMEFYDLLPKYIDFIYNSKPGMFLKTIKRRFVYDKKEYELSLQPARIETKEGEKERFPGKREQLVEDALRKIAMESGEDCMFFDGMIGLKFTLHQLQKELKDRGCSASLDEIKQSLRICAKSIMEIKTVDGAGNEFTVVSPLFQTLIINERADYLSGKKWCFVRFHPLVTRAITKKEFRLYDYESGMKLKSILSRYLYKRLCYNFKQAALGEPYTIHLTTLIRDGGFDSNLPLWKNLQKFKRAVQELIKIGKIQDVEYEQRKEGRKIIDVLIRILPTDEFSAKMIKSHFVKRELGTNPK